MNNKKLQKFNINNLYIDESNKISIDYVLSYRLKTNHKFIRVYIISLGFNHKLKLVVELVF